jgi:hypothetical protein
MILEAVPALPTEHRNGHQVIKRASHHYAEALGEERGPQWWNGACSVPFSGTD